MMTCWSCTRSPVAAAGGEELFGEDLEEGFPQDGGDGVGALGAIVAEAGALAARDGEGGDATGAQGGLSGGLGGIPVGRGAPFFRQRREGGGRQLGPVDGGFTGSLDEGGGEAVEFGEVDFGQLSEQVGALMVRERFPEAEDVALAVLCEVVAELGGMHLGERCRISGGVCGGEGKKRGCS